MKTRAILACCLMAMAGQSSALTFGFPADANPASLGLVGDVVFNVNQDGNGVGFSHYFRFTSAGALSGVTATAFVTPIEFGGTPYADIADLSMWLRTDDGGIDGDEFVWGSDTLGQNDFTLKISRLIPAGDYYLQISGTTASGATIMGGAYVAGVTVSPVPEAETWAMLATGLGLVGLRLRRRSHGGKPTR